MPYTSYVHAPAAAAGTALRHLREHRASNKLKCANGACIGNFSAILHSVGQFNPQKLPGLVLTGRAPGALAAGALCGPAGSGPPAAGRRPPAQMLRSEVIGARPGGPASSARGSPAPVPSTPRPSPHSSAPRPLGGTRGQSVAVGLPGLGGTRGHTWGRKSTLGATPDHQTVGRAALT